MKYFYDVYSEIGSRSCNEDSFLALETEKGYLFAVADGLGGHGSGEIASKRVVDTLRELYLSDADFDLCDTINIANGRIVEEQRSLGNDMMSTVVAVWIKEAGVEVAHVGDSRAYLFDGKEIVFQTKDHSMAQIAVDRGEITSDQIRMYKGRNTLLRALGSDGDVTVSTKVLSNDSYDRLLLCSDGFWEYVREDEMAATIRSRRSCMKWRKKMVKVLKKRVPKGDDNATLIVACRGGEHNG